MLVSLLKITSMKVMMKAAWGFNWPLIVNMLVNCAWSNLFNLAMNYMNIFGIGFRLQGNGNKGENQAR